MKTTIQHAIFCVASTVILSISLISFHFAAHWYTETEKTAKTWFNEQRLSFKRAYLTYTGQTLTSPYSAMDLKQLVRLKAPAYGFDAKLIESLIDSESSWNIQAVSNRGALGLMQIMPSWVGHEICRGVGSHAELFDAEKNLDCGLSILAHETRKHRSIKLALQAYNGGSKCTNMIKNPSCFSTTEAYANQIIHRVAQKMFY